MKKNRNYKIKKMFPIFLLLFFVIVLSLSSGISADTSETTEIKFFAVFAGEPLEDVSIKIGQVSILTNGYGFASFNLIPGEYEYQATKNGFQTIEDTFDTNDYEVIIEMHEGDFDNQIIPIAIAIGVVIIGISLILPKRYR